MLIYRLTQSVSKNTVATHVATYKGTCHTQWRVQMPCTVCYVYQRPRKIYLLQVSTKEFTGLFEILSLVPKLFIIPWIQMNKP